MHLPKYRSWPACARMAHAQTYLESSADCTSLHMRLS